MKNSHVPTIVNLQIANIMHEYTKVFINDIQANADDMQMLDSYVKTNRVKIYARFDSNGDIRITTEE